MTKEQRDIILNEIIINNPKIRQDLLQACSGAQLDFDKLKEVLPPAAFVSKTPQGSGPRKAVVHRFWKPHTKDTLTISTCRDILIWLSNYGELLTSDVDKFIDVVLNKTSCPLTFNGALDLIHNNILDVLYTADIIKPSKLTLHRDFDIYQNPIVDDPTVFVRTIKQSRKEQNNNDYDLFEENDMNIYKQLNKINDTESLSEKYNVKNAKELKKLQESYKSREHLTEAMTQYVDLPRHIRWMLNDLGEESKIYNFSAVGQAITDNGGISDEQLQELQRIYDDSQAKWSSLNMWDDNSKARKAIVDTSAYEVMSLFGVKPNNQLPNDVMNIIYDAVQAEYAYGTPDATLWNEIEQKLRGKRYNKKAAKKYFDSCLSQGSDEYYDDFDD